MPMGIGLSLGLPLAPGKGGGAAPALQLSATTVAENATVGTVVATLSVTGLPGGVTVTGYTLTSNVDGKFSISGSQLQVAAGLDYETATSHNITISAALSAGGPIAKAVTISVTNVFEAADLVPLTLAAAEIVSGSAAGTVVGAVVGKTSGSALTLTNDAGGRFALSGGNIVAGMTATDYSSATSHSITIRETLADSSNSPRDSAITITVASAFSPLNPSVASLDDLGSKLAALSDSGGVQSGGTLTVNGVSLGAYDYIIKAGNQTVAAFSSADWFSATADSVSAVVVVKGDLTINAGQVFRPSARKLFSLIYVTGTLTVVGEISMSARGANHSAATGSNVAAGDVLIINGTHGGVTNPKVPSAGGAGVAAGQGGSNNPANNGLSGTAGGTGGGGRGAAGAGGTAGAGAAGTSYSGGPAAGGVDGSVGEAAGTAGGKGGNFAQSGNFSASGGAGNPGGSGGANSGRTGGAGTGGVLVVFCGSLAGAGVIVAAGAAGGSGTGSGGGGSGGGSITVVFGLDTSSITPSASGGAGGTGARIGGSGGSGTARKLQRAA